MRRITHQSAYRLVAGCLAVLASVTLIVGGLLLNTPAVAVIVSAALYLASFSIWLMARRREVGREH